MRPVLRHKMLEVVGLPPPNACRNPVTTFIISLSAVVPQFVPLRIWPSLHVAAKLEQRTGCAFTSGSAVFVERFGLQLSDRQIHASSCLPSASFFCRLPKETPVHSSLLLSCSLRLHAQSPCTIWLTYSVWIFLASLTVPVRFATTFTMFKFLLPFQYTNSNAQTHSAIYSTSKYSSKIRCLSESLNFYANF